jgi:hypothetical protein
VVIGGSFAPGTLLRVRVRGVAGVDLDAEVIDRRPPVTGPA